MKLTDRIGEDVIEYKGREIRLSLFFDRVLRAFELLNDPYFTEAEKVEILLHMLVENYDAVIAFKSKRLNDKGKRDEGSFTPSQS